MPQPLWSIVLAAGQGRRLSSVTGGVPKQYWTPPGRQSLLEDTLDRMRALAPIANTVTVIDRSHRPYVDALSGARELGQVVAQPVDRGTAVGVMLGLSEVMSDPDRVVVLTPSDHGVADPTEFRQGIRLAVGEIAAGRAEIVLFAVRPSSPHGDYGWIVPSGKGLDGLPFVETFIEKPTPDEASVLLARGAACSTMVLVARAGALSAAFRKHLPELVRVFDRAVAMDPRERSAFLAEIYSGIAPADFSRDLLTHARNVRLHVWPAGLGWTDLGVPDRLQDCLSRRTPARIAAHRQANVA
jgi:mannose-1-phosphate guanylyltransferase